MLVIIVFNVVALTVVGVIHLYLWRRLIRDTVPRGRIRRAATAGLVLLALLIPAGRTWEVEWLTWSGYVWLTVMFYLLILLALLEVVRLGVHAHRWWKARPADGPQPRDETAPSEDTTAGVDRRALLSRGAAITAGLAAVGITGYGVRSAARPPELNREQIVLAKLPRSMDGTRLVVVSDIHIGPLRASHRVDRIVEVINDADADIVCVVGDLVDGTVGKLGRYARPLADIRARRGAYFVTGNHEYYSGYEPWIREVADLGIRPLRNELVELDGLDLAGVNDLGGADYGDPADFDKALGGRDRARPVVLMAHQPVVAREAARYGVDLQVSGHTHGGQMVPFNQLVRLQQPVTSGLGRVDGVPVFVTNGAGFWGPPVRVGVPAQVTLLELRSGQA